MDSQDKSKILVVDDVGLCALLHEYLEKQGFAVATVEDAKAMDAYLEKSSVDLIILDLMLPGEDGLSIAKRINSSKKLPIIMLSACGEEVDRIIGLEVGADDYLAKPFSPRELLARIRSVLRRYAPIENTSSTEQTQFYYFGAYQLDTLSQSLKKDSVSVAITQGEYSLLKIFLENPNRVLSRDTLLEKLKGYECMPFDRSVDVRVMRLRQKIETDSAKPEYIHTVWGEGYRFVINKTS